MASAVNGLPNTALDTYPVNTPPPMRRDADGFPSEEYMMFGPSGRVDYGFRDDFVTQEPGVRRAAGDIERSQSTRPAAMQVAANYRPVRIKV